MVNFVVPAVIREAHGYTVICQDLNGPAEVWVTKTDRLAHTAPNSQKALHWAKQHRTKDAPAWPPVDWYFSGRQ
jgi:hypothetical protein